MINQERVREMTHLAMLESGIGEKELNISAYKRIDYVILSVLKGFVAGTVCFAAFLALWFFWQWDSLNRFFSDADYLGFLKEVLFYYLIFMVIYLAVCGIVAVWRHKACRQRRKQYLQYLHRLNRSSAKGGDDV